MSKKEVRIEHFKDGIIRSASDDFQKFIYEHKLTKADIICTCAYYDGTNAHIILTYNHRRLKE